MQRFAISSVIFALILAFPCFAGAQVIQLPTFNTTTASTTVNIPDRGGVLIGGVKRGAEGSSEFGVPGLSKIPGVNRLFRNKGISRTSEASTISAHAYIMNFDEMDAMILQEAAQRRAARGLPSWEETLAAEARAAKLRQMTNTNDRNIVTESNTTNQLILPTAEQLAQQNQQAAEKRQMEAEQYYEKAKSLAIAGKRKLAAHYLGMAARRAEGDFQQEITAALGRLESQAK